MVIHYLEPNCLGKVTSNGARHYDLTILVKGARYFFKLKQSFRSFIKLSIAWSLLHLLKSPLTRDIREAFTKIKR